LIAERGYAATSVVDIVRVAQASKTTFYLYFANKQECYLALLASVTDDLVADIRQAVDSDAHWHNQIRQMFTAYIAHLTARPAISLSWIRDLPALGAAARPIQRRNFAELAALLGELGTNPGFQRAGLPPITRPKAVMLLAGVRELAAQTAEDDLDIESVIGPATDIAISILATGQ
jgi:AcrR family transcriptional regulator